MATTLRPYQQAAVEAVYEYLRTWDDNPIVVLPSAAGKSFVIAQIVTHTVLRWHGRVLVLAHVKELLEQSAEKIRVLCPEVPVGIYSAGLNRRETDKPGIVAGYTDITQYTWDHRNRFYVGRSLSPMPNERIFRF